MAKPFLDGRLLSAMTRAPSSEAFTSDFVASYAVDVKTFSFSLANYHLKCHWRCFMRGTVTSCDGASTIRSTSKRWRWRWWLSRCFTSNICETILFRFHFSPPCFVFRRATRFSHFFFIFPSRNHSNIYEAQKNYPRRCSWIFLRAMSVIGLGEIRKFLHPSKSALPT